MTGQPPDLGGARFDDLDEITARGIVDQVAKLTDDDVRRIVDKLDALRVQHRRASLDARAGRELIGSVLRLVAVL